MDKVYLKIIVLIITIILFLSVFNGVINRYTAYKISIDKNIDIIKAQRAVRLDPANDKYHFLLGNLFAMRINIKGDKNKIYIRIARKEIEEAIKLNPWEDYYKVYLKWLDGLT